MDSATHFPSTWRQPIGKLLSSRRIGQYALVGRYGPEMKRAELKKQAEKKNRVIAECVGCGSKGEVLYRSYEYLEQKGYWCNICIATIRESREQERELAAKVRQQMKEFFA